ncbi:MAG TPA: hypothetical protein VF092_08230 [Longimicrobium sp.]
MSATTAPVTAEPAAAPAQGCAPRADGSPTMCPSAQPHMEGAFVFGVLGGTVEERRVGYLPERVPLTDEVTAMAGPVRVTEVFRIAAPCAEGACKHFDGHDCRLATKLVQLTPQVTEALPACAVRPDCRWWKQEGKRACRVCPAVRTTAYIMTDEERQASDPTFLLPQMAAG